MNIQKASGVLLHPTSLPSKYGIGDLGPAAYKFIDFLSKSKQKYWQVLPLNPVGYGESPYQPFSAFAGNPLLISIDKLMEDKLISTEEVKEMPFFNTEKVEFAKVRDFKDKLLWIAFQRFKQRLPKIEEFCQANQLWLDNYALFMALKQHFGGISWNLWSGAIKERKPEVLTEYQQLLEDEVNYHKFLQYKFFSQWLELKKYAEKNKIKIIGDVPIFVAYDSSDVWANPHLFKLDEQGEPLQVAGVPPDYFSATGQLWGNPHYNWQKMYKNDFKWWRERFKCILKLVDLVRIDHFRGFVASWEIPAGEKTAVNGKWVKGPGKEIFQTLENYLGKLPVIAEDLGVITKEVEILKNKLNYPGMVILHFIFEDTTKALKLPLRFSSNSVVYTGTHDNDTTLGWFIKHCANTPEVVKNIQENLEINCFNNKDKVCWRFIELAYESNALLAIIPLQDLLCLDSSARMNTPGTLGGNWDWRFKEECLTEELAERLNKLVEKYNR